MIPILRRLVAIGAIAAALTSTLPAHDLITTNLTYTRDISRILARRCVSCHGADASIPLTRYEEVRPWAVGIKEQVLKRLMPPWGAVKGFGNLEPDHALTQEEIMIIAAWVIGGAPNGDPAMLPRQQPPQAEQAVPVLEDALEVSTRAVLVRPLILAALRPTGTQTVVSARVVARLPGGRIEPLVWLYQFDPQSHRSFRLRKPLALPAGTVIEASGPLHFAVETPTTKSLSRGS